MLKKLLIALLISIIFWGLLRHKEQIPIGSETPNSAEIKKAAASGKNFMPSKDVKSNNEIVIINNRAANQPNAVAAQTKRIDFTWDGRKLRPITAAEHQSKYTQNVKPSSPDAIWSARKFIITTSFINHPVIAQNNAIEMSQQIQADSQIDDATEPDKVRCPLVEKIQQTAPQINDAFLHANIYAIVSYEPVFQDNNLNWLVGVGGIVADSSYEAISMAGIAISATNQRKNEYTEMLDGSFTSNGAFTLYACYYGPGDIIALGIWDKVPIEE